MGNWLNCIPWFYAAILVIWIQALGKNFGGVSKCSHVICDETAVRDIDTYILTYVSSYSDFLVVMTSVGLALARSNNKGHIYPAYTFGTGFPFML